MSKATDAIELEITQQTSRREMVKRYLLQGAMVPGTRMFSAHSARVDSLAYEIAGLRRALGAVKKAEAQGEGA